MLVVLRPNLSFHRTTRDIPLFHKAMVAVLKSWLATYPPPTRNKGINKRNQWLISPGLVDQSWSTEARPQNVAFWCLNVREAISVFLRSTTIYEGKRCQRNPSKFFRFWLPGGGCIPSDVKTSKNLLTGYVWTNILRYTHRSWLLQKPQPLCMIRKMRSVIVGVAITSIWPKLAHKNL